MVDDLLGALMAGWRGIFFQDESGSSEEAGQCVERLLTPPRFLFRERRVDAEKQTGSIQRHISIWRAFHPFVEALDGWHVALSL
jgi:hypothetical protein